ncbi:MAG TPA: 1,4-alpha-glucan branching protein GlgB [Candidatus Acidoferrales bacterium]|nr:1,4-alpha-glucan branching protein GlgB [Candidatus Acidoferrales bacterium]
MVHDDRRNELSILENAGAPADAASSATPPANPEIDLLLRAEHSDPFHFLGPHPANLPGKPALAIRTLQPHATQVTILWGKSGEEYPATRVHPGGLYEAIIPLAGISSGKSPGASSESYTPDIAPTAYRLRITYPDGKSWDTYDPYAFAPLLTDLDLYLIGEGTHYQNYEKLGAHVREVAGVRGVHFGVWAPNAKRISVVGNFNSWDGRVNPMRSRDSTGVWEIFIPGLSQGDLYKFEIRSRFNDVLTLKADPYGFAGELRPKSSSVVVDIEGYSWQDSEWLDQRLRFDWQHAPISIYEVHFGSWRRVDGGRWLTYSEMADELIPYVKQMGYTHIELMPMMEHPFDASWGYQTIGYFAVTSRYGSPKDFMAFVDRCHQAGIGVLLDWTPGHFPRDAHGLSFFDGTHLYEHADPRRGAHPDWGTLIFNYGRNEVQNFLLSNALFWLDKYHIDGLRVDAVASMLYLDYSRRHDEWLPNQFGGRENLEAIAFLKRLNEVVHTRQPGTLMIAEESTSWPSVSRPTYAGGLGFDLKWNMGWMNDTLRYFALDPIHRKFHHGELTFSMLYAFNENFILPLSHDEVVHGKHSLIAKMPGDDMHKFANLRLLYGYFYAHPGKKLLFMGLEIAQWNEWWENTSIDWHLLQYAPHQGIQRLVKDLNHLYAKEPALHEVEFEWQGFEWLEVHDADASVLAFLRRGRRPEDFLAVVCNFTPVSREDYRLGVPEPGFYREILNTDSAYYSGGDVGNIGGVRAEPIPWSGRPHSIKIKLPPLSVLYFKPQRD